MSKPVTFEVEPAQTASTWPVMQQLRPHLNLEKYLEMVARMRQKEGFRLAAASVDGKVGAVAGFLRLDELTQGYYTGWLRLAAAGLAGAVVVGLLLWA